MNTYKKYRGPEADFRNLLEVGVRGQSEGFCGVISLGGIEKWVGDLEDDITDAWDQAHRKSQDMEAAYLEEREAERRANRTPEERAEDEEDARADRAAHEWL